MQYLQRHHTYMHPCTLNMYVCTTRVYIYTHMYAKQTVWNKNNKLYVFPQNNQSTYSGECRGTCNTCITVYTCHMHGYILLISTHDTIPDHPPVSTHAPAVQPSCKQASAPMEGGNSNQLDIMIGACLQTLPSSHWNQTYSLSCSGHS